MIPLPEASRLLAERVSSRLRGRRSSRFGLFASGAAQALAGEFDAMRVVHEAVL